MFNFKNYKEEIKKKDNKIMAQKKTIADLCEENTLLYAEAKELRLENEELKLNKDIAEARNVEYARTIKAVLDELNTNQYGSVLNVQNKIKSMLTASGKHC